MRIGILGGGQLGRMLALAAHPLGHRVAVLAQSADEPACAVAVPFLGAFDDEALLDRFADAVDVVTYEFENVPTAAVARLARRVPVRPGLRSLEVTSDRWNEKTTFRALGIDTAPFRAIDDPIALEREARAMGFPCVLKTRRLGYDGKGQRVLWSEADLPGAFAALGGVPCILEGFVAFRRELSILGVRGIDEAVRCYPLVENEHRGGILRRTTAPAPDVAPALARRAEEAMAALLRELDHVGVLALELFEQDGALLANEIAPRVHNTGHFSIEGAVCSQFENHVRAVTGEPLGDVSLRGGSVMINLIGASPPRAEVLAIPGAHLHLYDKSPRPGRKIGHVTVRGDDAATLAARFDAVRALVRDDG
ncbi:MAG: 5-(carboxyamino)imidazole ribonucleotide synthase [Sandaracinaceae bacterium]